MPLILRGQYDEKTLRTFLKDVGEFDVDAGSSRTIAEKNASAVDLSALLSSGGTERLIARGKLDMAQRDQLSSGAVRWPFTVAKSFASLRIAYAKGGFAFSKGHEAWVYGLHGSQSYFLYPQTELPSHEHHHRPSISRWFEWYYYAAQGTETAPIECEIRAGDLLFIPEGWWHASYNNAPKDPSNRHRHRNAEPALPHMEIYLSRTTNATRVGGLWDKAFHQLRNGDLNATRRTLLQINTTSSQYVLGRVLTRSRRNHSSWKLEELEVKKDVVRRTHNRSCDALFELATTLYKDSDAVAAKTVARECISLCVDHHLCYKLLSKAVILYTKGVKNVVARDTYEFSKRYKPQTEVFKVGRQDVAL